MAMLDIDRLKIFQNSKNVLVHLDYFDNSQHSRDMDYECISYMSIEVSSVRHKVRHQFPTRPNSVVIIVTSEHFVSTVTTNAYFNSVAAHLCS